MRRWLVALSVLLVADFAAGHLLIRWRPELDLPRSERQGLARLEQERIERQYRVESAIYDHDLARQFDGVAGWGPLRYRVATNSLGFRDASPRVVPLKSTQPRVLLIGDSFTEGIGLEFGETYAGIITNDLRRDGIEVLNAGVTSYSPAIYYAKARYLLEDAGLQCTDLVIFIDISDAEDEARYYDLRTDGRVTRMIDQRPGHGPAFDEGDAESVRPPATLMDDGHRSQRVETAAVGGDSTAAVAAPSSHGFLASWKRRSLIGHAFDAVREWRNPGEDPHYPRANPRRGLWTVDERDYDAFGRTGLELGSRHMDRLVALLRRHAIRLTIAVYPWPEQLKYDTADSIQVRYWRGWAARRGVRFVDLFAPFFAVPDRAEALRRLYIPGDVHFNAQGARLLATEFLARWRETS